MPAIPECLLDSVVYLFADAATAVSGSKDCGGTGFLVGVPSTTHPSATHLYVVSNWHVVKGKGESPVVRVKKKSGGVDVIELDVLDWEHIPNGGDVVVAKACLNPEIHQFTWIPVGIFCLESDGAQHAVGIGDDVFMAGRFVDHDGGLTNAPAVRFGNISVLPAYVPSENSDHSVRYYCLDMHSRTGFSGSPVFVYRTLGASLSKALSQPFVHNDAPFMRLLGIHCSQFQEIMPLMKSEPPRVSRRPVGLSQAIAA